MQPSPLRTNVHRVLTLLLLAAFLGGSETKSFAQDGAQPNKIPSNVKWQMGPSTAKLGDQAEIDLHAGFRFADSENTRKFLEDTQNFPSGKELGTVIPEKGNWFAILEFDPVGYVKDDEKDKLDADALLKDIQEGTEAANVERRKRGWDTFSISGWMTPPYYDQVTHQLTWCVVGQDSGGGRSANYLTRILGRHGVMSVELIASPEELNSILPVFQSAVTRPFSFNSETRYSAFVKGDKVAEYGLSALIVGGVAAAAVKTGFLKYIFKLLIVGWKFVLVGFGALVGVIRKLFKGRENAPEQTSSEQPS